MTDLEITKLCAEAMGVFGTITPSGDKIWMKGSTQIYNPLRSDAKAMALVKKFLIQVEREDSFHPRWIAYLKYKTGSDSVRHKDLNRAICECVAKMQKAKHRDVQQES